MASTTATVVMTNLTKWLYNDAASNDGPNDDDNKNAVMVEITKTATIPTNSSITWQA